MDEDTDKPLLTNPRGSPDDIELQRVGGTDPERNEKSDDKEDKEEAPHKLELDDIRKLKRLALRGNVTQVKILLDTYPGDVKALVNGSEEDGWTVLHSAVRGATVPVIQTLIEAGAEVNKLDADGASPLHCAAAFGPNDGMNVVQYLVGKGADISLQDKYGNTPLHEAIGSKQNIVTSFILDHPACSTKYIELKNKHGETALHRACHYNVAVQMLVDKGAGILSTNSNGWTPLHYACGNRQEEACHILLDAGRAQIKLQDMLKAANSKGDTPLHVAARAGAISPIQLCFSHGADVLARNNEKKNPLHLAAEQKDTESFLSLFDPEEWLDAQDQRTAYSTHHPATREDYLKNLTSLVGEAVSQRDKYNHNCLDIAIQHDNEDVAMAIVKSQYCREALMNPVCYSPPMTPMRGLIKKMPDVAEQAMTQCMNPVEDSIPDHMDRLDFIPSYSFIDDTWSIMRGDPSSEENIKENSTMPVWKEKTYDSRGYLLPEQQPYSWNSTILRTNHPLILMCLYHDGRLLNHNLVKDLIYHKWDSLGRYVYYTTLLIYLIFLLFFTGYTLTSIPPYDPRAISETNLTIAASTERTTLQIVFIDVGKWIVVALLCLYILRELMEMYSWRVSYFTHTENLIEWLLFFTAILFIMDITDDGIRTHWQWQIGAIAIFLAWINLVLFIRKLPLLGIYIVMVVHVLKTFLLFSPVFLLFVAAFGLSFTVLFKNQYEFQTVGHSFIKTFVMMVGELDFTDIFFGYEENKGEYTHTVFYGVTSYAMFVIFLFLMTIIIMNLLVGLAVDDIQGVQESAEIRRLEMQVELVIDLEFLVPLKLYRRCIRHVPTGDVCCPALNKVYKPVLQKIDKTLNPKRPPDPVLTGVEELKVQGRELQEQGKLIREQGKLIQELQEQQQRLMRQMARQMNKVVKNQEILKERTTQK